MNTKVVLIVGGLAMIAAGVGGIAAFEARRDAQVTLSEARDLSGKQAEEASRINSEHQRVEEQRQSVEAVAKRLEADRLKIAEEQKRVAEKKRELEAKEAARRTVAAREASRKTVQTAKKNTTRTASASSKVAKPVGNRKLAKSAPTRKMAQGALASCLGAQTPKRNGGTDSTMAKAGREAAGSHERVLYTNRTTRERIMAEPFGSDRLGTRVRIRIWRDGLLVLDTFKTYPRLYSAR